jgi:hypothetical protein
VSYAGSQGRERIVAYRAEVLAQNDLSTGYILRVIEPAASDVEVGDEVEPLNVGTVVVMLLEARGGAPAGPQTRIPPALPEALSDVQPGQPVVVSMPLVRDGQGNGGYTEWASWINTTSDGVLMLAQVQTPAAGRVRFHLVDDVRPAECWCGQPATGWYVSSGFPAPACPSHLKPGLQITDTVT